MVDIRLATDTDLDAIARIHVDSWNATYRGLIDDRALAERTVEVRAEQWREYFAERPEDHLVAVAELDGEIVGFSRAGRSDDGDVDRDVTANVFALYLDPARRGHGIGRELLEWTLHGLRDRGFEVATLYTLIGNDSARRFYERNGWTLDEGVVSECLGDGYPAPQVRYRKSVVGRSHGSVA